MKKYLLIGLALIAANGFTSARAADSCSTLTILNASGSPPVVVGNEVNVVGYGPAQFTTVYLDGSAVAHLIDPSAPPSQIELLPGVVLVGAYGSHTLQTSFDPDGCVINFSTVAPPPPPPPPPLPPPVIDNSNGHIACPSALVEWAAVPGATSYQIWSREMAPTLEPAIHQNWATTRTSITVTLGSGQSFNYAVAACNSSGCSNLSTLDLLRYGTCD